VAHLEFKEEGYRETSVNTPMWLGLKMKANVENVDEPVMFTDCADAPYRVSLADNKNFKLHTTASKGASPCVFSSGLTRIFFLQFAVAIRCTAHARPSPWRRRRPA